MITAFLDANVLYPVTQRAVLMELARADAFAPLWTEAVHQEWMRNLAAKEPHIKPAQIARLRALMEACVGNVMVTGYEMLIDGLILPDPDDRHVLAAAIHGGASVIVTSNLKDFPAGTLALYNITAEHPMPSCFDYSLTILTACSQPWPMTVPTLSIRRERRPVSGDPRTWRAGDNGFGVTPIC